ncbi:hypothetical protein L3Q82_000603 [Scortum barcoo]|uniref:Uncharacterized protein n=1 Tax=Scortum barcoo TaxID=214431 RepID=A0ACB8WEV5_9TELE|nr:hypothetical protein L3Q82_000603 [Scortum barcoo]
MILLSALLFLLWGEHAGGFTFNGDLRHLAVAANRVYISTEERLYQLNHDLTPVQSLTQRGLLTAAERVEDQHFHRVSETDDGNATFRVNILLPFVQNQSLVSCGVIDNHCGYCEVLDLNNISNVRYREQIQVGAPFNSNKTVSFLVDVKKTEKTEKTETYILTGSEQHKDKYKNSQCPYEEYAVKLHNTNNDQKGGNIFRIKKRQPGAAIKHEGTVEFVDGFQINLTAYLFSNLPSEDNRNKVRLIWLEGKIK